MKKKGFTLIEIIIMVMLLSIFYSLVLKLNINYHKKHYENFLLKIKNKINPYGFFLILNNGNVIILKNKKYLFKKENSKPIKIEKTFFDNTKNIKFYSYTKTGWQTKTFGIYKNEKILFEYQVYNNLNKIPGILEINDKYFVIKPFEIKKFDSLSKAKDYYFLLQYQPYKGIL